MHEEEIKEIKKQTCKEIIEAETCQDIERIRIKYLGKKGKITSLLKVIKTLPQETKPFLGKILHDLKEEFQVNLTVKKKELEAIEKEKNLEEQKIDITLPGTGFSFGKKHPIIYVLEEITNIFLNLGFNIAEGPEIESEYYNFESLNFPKDHPARDMQATFYIDDKLILRTHTSPVQIRVMEKEKIPIRIIALGKVYRCDIDISHSPMFHQVEGLLVDEETTFGDLKGVLIVFVQEMFGNNIKLRFRPSFFPFTEPSVEVDISCLFCKAKGCKICKNTGWLEILGAGMVNPAVFKVVQYDPDKVQGFAFGMGVERIAMLKFGIDDIRLFFQNDKRFLEQF